MFDHRTTSSRAHRTTILINDPDWKFMKQRGYKATNLLRSKIRELVKKDQEGGIDYQKIAENFKKRFLNATEILSKILTKKQFEEFMNA